MKSQLQTASTLHYRNKNSSTQQILDYCESKTTSFYWGFYLCNLNKTNSIDIRGITLKHLLWFRIMSMSWQKYCVIRGVVHFAKITEKDISLTHKLNIIFLFLYLFPAPFFLAGFPIFCSFFIVFVL